MYDKYKFKILREEVETEDFYEDKTHQKIKDSLFHLIKNEDQGITIGLSGQWGSGKSTIINLLKKEKEFLFFYFDAWAHEGDPLRRIFLESFINCLKDSENDNNILSKLEEKRAIVSREKRTKITIIERSTTILGLCLAIATLVLTIGIAFLSAVNYENLTLIDTSSINLPFIIGILFSSSPFFVLFINLLALVYRGEDIKDLKNWAFIQNNSNETITEDIIGDDERSSIEFEKYFKEILEISNSISTKKIIIVLDNLDRVDAEVSLKIWSTLQTFIQHKNPASKEYKIFKNIFTIIPYDEESLMKIWKNYNEDNEGNKIIDNSFAKSFFDKSFQVRIDVPKPIVSNWLGFIDSMMNEAFNIWPENDKQSVKEVIEKTRKTILDNPRPREIKTFLNQVGFLRNHFNEDISTKSISFYSFKRYLEGKSNDEISKYLLNFNEIPKEEINLIEEDTIQEVAAIIYGVDKDKGAQILLSPKILDALKNNKPDVLKDLSFNYGKVFWAIFKKIITDTNNLRDYLRYSTPLNFCFEEFHSDIKTNYIKFTEKYLLNEKEFTYHFDENFSIDISNTSDLLFKYEKSISLKKLWNFYTNVYLYEENKAESINNIHSERNISFIETLYHIYSTTGIQFDLQVVDIQYVNWVSINKQEIFQEIFHLIHPSNKLISRCSTEISQNVFDEDTYLFINNCLKSSVENINPIIESLDKLLKTFNANRAQFNNSVFNSKLLILIENIYYNHYLNYDFDAILKNSQFYAICNHIDSNDKEITKHIATICSLHFNDKILSIETEIVLQDYSNQSIFNRYNKKIKDFWLISNAENAQYTYDKFKENQLLKYVWTLSKDSNNLLVLDILDLMVHNEDDSEFIIDNPIEILIQISNSIKDDFDISKIVEKFIQYADLEKKFIQAEDLNLATHNFIIYEILKNSESNAVLEKVEDELKHLNSIILKESLLADDYIFDILLEVKEGKDSFALGNIFSDALYEFSFDTFLKNNSVSDLSEWQKDNWSNIVKLLDQIHLDNFGKRISKLIIDEKENLLDTFFELNDEFIDKSFLIGLINKEVEEFKLYIQGLFTNVVDINKFNYVQHILKLESESVKKINFGKDYKILIEPLIKSKTYIAEIQTIVKNIAKRFQ